MPRKRHPESLMAKRDSEREAPLLISELNFKRWKDVLKEAIKALRESLKTHMINQPLAWLKARGNGADSNIGPPSSRRTNSKSSLVWHIAV